MTRIDRTALKLSIWDIIRGLNNLNDLPDDVLDFVPQEQMGEILEEIKRFKDFTRRVESEITLAKTWRKLKRTVDADA